jgi:hypothetical protein
VDEIQDNFSSRYRNRIIAKPIVLTITVMSVFDRLALYIVSAPVEEKGYKRIFKLPDGLNKQKDMLKS